jgi:hypothetical protein
LKSLKGKLADFRPLKGTPLTDERREIRATSVQG